MNVKSPRSGEIRMSWEQLRELDTHVLLGEDIDHLRCIADHRLQLVAGHEGRADVDRDHDVRTHGADDVDRQIVDEAAVAQIRPSISTGANIPGTDMLARMAWYSRPWSNTTW